MLEIFETSHWLVTHREDSRFLGHLIVASKEEVSNISELTSESLKELGNVIARAEKLLIGFCDPLRVITAKLGFNEGFSCHFHIVPVSNNLLNQIVSHPGYSDEPDGNDALLFLSREYCERSLSSKEVATQLSIVKALRAELVRLES